MGVSPTSVNDIFKFADNTYNLRNIIQLIKQHTTESASRICLKYLDDIWNLIPNEIKTVNVLDAFRNKIKKLIFQDCPYWLDLHYSSWFPLAVRVILHF